MLRIFRSLRKKGILNKSKYYFWYAFGEIFLVVIGILIALYINNESEAYKEKQNEIILLKKLKEENLYNINTIADSEEYHKKSPEIFASFVDYLSENKIDNLSDTLSYFMNETMRTPYYSFSEGNLDNFIASQKNNFPEINKQVIYLKNLQEDLSKVTQRCVDIKLKDYYKFLNSDLDFYTGQLYSTEKMNSVNFRNNIFLLQNVETEVSRIFKLTITQLRKVDSLINVTLENN